MFDIHCSACDRRQLISPGRIRGLVNDGNGIHVLYVCWCGAPGTWHTGAARASTMGTPHRLAS